ncbi:LexA family protein [Pseudoalteromonas marina]|uniref:S24 family peptidase n=1 Tax=Pseudoalteromonas marina TaxID=267375 RepID=A0ABT9FI10_9GAMM|nr:S24 family peptidase [Pseudoalteromonas marina]MDP2566423.1 S24 family peptidase [Pseudoalteromonas marina]
MITSNIDMITEFKSLGKTLDELFFDQDCCFVGQVSGESMVDAGIFPGNVLIINRRLKPVHMDIIVCVFNGQFICKYIDLKNNQLISANDKYKPVKITEHDEFSLEGVVANSLNFFRKPVGLAG